MRSIHSGMPPSHAPKVPSLAKHCAFLSPNQQSKGLSVILTNTEASPSHGRPGACSEGYGSVPERRLLGRRLSPFPVRGPHCPQLWGTGLTLYLANCRQLHAMAFRVWSQTSQ